MLAYVYALGGVLSVGGVLSPWEAHEILRGVKTLAVRMDRHCQNARALAAGASEMMPPAPLPRGMGWIAIVRAPGGVAIGLWSMK